MLATLFAVSFVFNRIFRTNVTSLWISFLMNLWYHLAITKSTGIIIISRDAAIPLYYRKSRVLIIDFQSSLIPWNGGLKKAFRHFFFFPLLLEHFSVCFFLEKVVFHKLYCSTNTTLKEKKKSNTPTYNWYECFFRASVGYSTPVSISKPNADVSASLIIRMWVLGLDITAIAKSCQCGNQKWVECSKILLN